MDVWVHAIPCRNSEALGASERTEGFMAGVSRRVRGYHDGGLDVKDYIAYLLEEIKAYPSLDLLLY
jgi:hypothetical protein